MFDHFLSDIIWWHPGGLHAVSLWCPCGDHVVFKSRSVFQCSVSVPVEVAVSRLAFHCLSLGLLSSVGGHFNAFPKTLCSKYLSSHVDCPVE